MAGRLEGFGSTPLKMPTAGQKIRLREFKEHTTDLEENGSGQESVLLHELESLDWRLERIEATFVRLVGVWSRITRLYRRIGHMMLRTPLAGVCHWLMGQVAADEKYRRWFAQHQATDVHAGVGGVSAATQPNGPLVSLVLPVYQPNPAWLRTAVDSVRRQTYPNWQLLVASDGDPGAEILAYLQSLPSEDSRIQFISGGGSGISSTLNRGLSACLGDYTAFIDQDDVLESTALAHVAAAVLDTGPDMLYTDEDYVDENGAAHLPLFKPAWSPALLLSCMYLGHLVVVNTGRLRALGGFRSAYDGAQDYDLALRLADQEIKVAHIPRVLYHWRRHPASTAFNHAAKPYSHPAGLRAIEETLTRRNINAVARGGGLPNHYQLSNTFSADDSAAIIIPTRDRALLSRLLGSMSPPGKDGLRREVHVILHCDGGKNDEETAAVARRFGAQIFEYRGPFNFALMNNLAAARVSSRYLVLINDDVVVSGSGWLEELCSPFARPEVGIVGARLHYPDGTIEHSGVVTGVGDGAGHSGRFQMDSPFWPWLGLTRNVAAVTGACMAIRRTLFEQLGGFDTRYFNNYNDVDLCLRAQSAGYEVILNACTVFSHDGGRTRRVGTSFRERMAFWTQWGNVLSRVDPFYSPNLSRRVETIDLSIPSWP